MSKSSSDKKKYAILLDKNTSPSVLNKSVIEIPGIGKVFGSKLGKLGYKKIINLLSEYRRQKKNDANFSKWLEDKCNSKSLQTARICSFLKKLDELFPRRCSSRLLEKEKKQKFVKYSLLDIYKESVVTISGVDNTLREKLEEKGYKCAGELQEKMVKLKGMYLSTNFKQWLEDEFECTELQQDYIHSCLKEWTSNHFTLDLDTDSDSD